MNTSTRVRTKARPDLGQAWRLLPPTSLQGTWGHRREQHPKEHTGLPRGVLRAVASVQLLVKVLSLWTSVWG